MKLKPYKNAYGYMIVDCPFCNQFSYVRDVTKISPDPIRDLKRHITNQAKNEALAGRLDETSFKEHLDYYLAHTQVKKIVQVGKREYDNDLTI